MLGNTTGFFKDGADTDYFMLVNRRCLPSEEQNVTVYIDNAEVGIKKMWYVIDQYTQDTTFTGAINGAIPFTTHLDPGEGKLFKLVPFPDSAFHGTAHPLNWQGGIMIDGDVTVDSVKTLVIQPPALIHFIANTDVKGTWNPDQCELIIYGGLQAVGNKTDSIYFTSTGDSYYDEWATIRVFSIHPCSTILSYCVVEFAYIGIILETQGSHTITHCRFHNNYVTGILAYTAKYATIADNRIYLDTTSDWSFYGIDLNWAGSASKIERNTIENYPWAGISAYGCSTTVSSNSILNGECGFESRGYNDLILENIHVSGGLTIVGLFFFPDGNDNINVNSCRVIGNPNQLIPIGVEIYPRSGTENYVIRDSEIKNFSEKGIYCIGTANVDLGTESSRGYNKIHSDSGYYVYYDQGAIPIGSPPDSVYAQYNWWGEYPPDSNRFHGNVIFMPAESLEWEEPDSSQQKIAVSPEMPKQFELYQNYPNPFNPVTSIQFRVGSDQSPAHITLGIYNILGQLVRTLVDEEKAEGTHTLYWDGRADNGKTVSSGIYFYRLEAGEFTDVKKMVLLR